MGFGVKLIPAELVVKPVFFDKSLSLQEVECPVYSGKSNFGVLFSDNLMDVLNRQVLVCPGEGGGYDEPLRGDLNTERAKFGNKLLDLLAFSVDIVLGWFGGFHWGSPFPLRVIFL